MKTPTLEEAADEFLNVQTIAERSEGRGKIFPDLQRLFAMRAAYWIRRGVSSRTSVETEPYDESQPGKAGQIPYTAMYELYRRLLSAHRSSDSDALDAVMREMGIRDLCPDLIGQLVRMERLAQGSEPHIGRVLHVELALFSFELDDESAVTRHVRDAWTLDPKGWERYILCTLQGHSDASSGNSLGAIRWLEESVSACLADEAVLIECENRPPILYLAQKLLSLGQRIPVIDYLRACQEIWRLKTMPFAKWVQQLESGQEVDFETSEIIRASRQTFHRLQLQSLRIYDHPSARDLDAPHPKRSRREVLLARDKRLEEAKRVVNEFWRRHPPN
jgi:hypothetical protein